jgi:hypothetical protein
MARNWLNFITATKHHHGMHTSFKYHLVNLQHVSINTNHHKGTTTDQGMVPPRPTSDDTQWQQNKVCKYNMHKIYCMYIPLAIPLHLYVSAWWWSVYILHFGSHHFTHISLHDDNLYIPLALTIPLHLYMTVMMIHIYPSPWELSLDPYKSLWWTVYTLCLGSTTSPAWICMMMMMMMMICIYPWPWRYHFTCTWLHDDDLYISFAFSYHFTRTSLHDDNLYIPLALTIPPHLYMTLWWWSVYTLRLGSYHLIHISLCDDDLYIPFALAIRLDLYIPFTLAICLTRTCLCDDLYIPSALAIHFDLYVSPWWWSVYNLCLGNTSWPVRTLRLGSCHFIHVSLRDDDLYIPFALAICLDPYVSPWWWSVYTLCLGNTSWPARLRDDDLHWSKGLAYVLNYI